MISTLVSVYGRPWFHPHELYASIGGVPVATAEHLIGNSLLKELDQFADPKYCVQQNEYNHEAYRRSVEKIKEYDAEMMMNNKRKKISTAKPEEKDEDWFDKCARDMDVMIEKVTKKESNKRCLRRSSRKQKH